MMMCTGEHWCSLNTSVHHIQKQFTAPTFRNFLSASSILKMRAVRCYWKHVIPTLTLLVHRLQNLRESSKFQDSAQQDLHISTATHTPQNANHLVFILSFIIYASYVTEVADQFLQHISVYFCNNVYFTHIFNLLNELNGCDTVITAYGTCQHEKRASCTNWSPLMCTVSKSAPFPAMWT